MPTYQYVCTDCGAPLEAVQKFTDNALTDCPACEGRLRKVFSAVGVVFKGSGFYRNDSRDTAKATSNGSGSKESSSANGSKESSGTSGSKESSGSSSGSGESSSSNGSSGSSSASSDKSTSGGDTKSGSKKAATSGSAA